MRFILDLRTRHESGIFRYAVEVTSRLLEREEFGRCLVLMTPAQSENLTRLLGGNTLGWTRQVFELDERTGVRRLLQSLRDAVYLSFDYAFEPGLARLAPCAFVLHDLIRYEDPGIIEASSGLGRTEAERVHARFQRDLRQATQLVRHIVVPSHVTAQRVVQEFRPRPGVVLVAPPGVPGRREQRVERRPTSIGLIVGRPQPHKNIDWLIEAWTAHDRVVPDALVICGRRSPQFEGVRSAARRSSVPVQVNVDLTDDLLYEAYDTAGALLVASRDEGWHLPSSEAAARGCPVVAPDLPIFRENLGPYAGWHRYEPGDGAGMKRAFARALQTPHPAPLVRSWTDSLETIATALSVMADEHDGLGRSSSKGSK